MRRRLAVTAAVLSALVGEWIGHSLSYFRVAGLAGLQAGLSGGVHAYMLPVGLGLLVVAAAGAAAWTRAWLALGRRLDRSAAALAGLRPGARTPVPASAGARRREEVSAATHRRRAPVGDETPSFAARVLALAAALAAVQCALYALQENLERALHGLPAGGLAPLLDDYGAAAAIQAALGLFLATMLLAGLRMLAGRRATVERREHVVRELWRRRLRGTSAPPPHVAHVLAAQLLYRSTLWCRPPPVLAPV